MKDAPRPDRLSVRLLIAGRVQGVFFRNWMIGEANRLNLDGWVRNRADGTVEAVIAGPRPGVEELAELCRQGPAAANVTSIDRQPAPDPGAKGFTKAATA